MHTEVPAALRSILDGAAKAAGDKKGADIDGIDNIRFIPLPLETSGALSHGFAILSCLAMRMAVGTDAHVQVVRTLFCLATHRTSIAPQSAQQTILQVACRSRSVVTGRELPHSPTALRPGHECMSQIASETVAFCN